MKKILLIISIITLFSACKKDFSVWKNFNDQKLKEYEELVNKSSEDAEVDTAWVSPTDLLVQVYHRGFGAVPKLESIVYCTYAGFLADGTKFDSYTYNPNSASNSYFTVGNTIKAWQEILCQMRQGSHFKIYVPYELGYGKEGSKGTTFIVPPYSTLIFDIEINEVIQVTPQ